MRVSHWTDFSPSSSQIDNIYGGIKGTPEIGYTEYNSPSRTFGAIAYRLAVSPDHNGYHHFMGMYTSIQGVAYENACVKKDCRTGFHHICINFSMPKYQFTKTQSTAGPQATDLYDVSANQFREASYRSTFMYSGDISANAPNGSNKNYGTNSIWGDNTLGHDGITYTGRIQDLFVLRPTLVHPTNANNRFDLWDVNTYLGPTTGGQQMFFTGIPMGHPRFALNTFTSNPAGLSGGYASTTWTSVPSNFAMGVAEKFEEDFASKSINLNAGQNNTVITWSNPTVGQLYVATSLVTYPSNSSATNSSGHSLAHSSGTLFMTWKFVGGAVDGTATVTITLTNNSETASFTITCTTGSLAP